MALILTVTQIRNNETRPSCRAYLPESMGRSTGALADYSDFALRCTSHYPKHTD